VVSDALAVNLLLDVAELDGFLRAELRPGGDAVDAFLLAAGLSQVAEDELHRDRWELRRVGARLGRPAPAMANALRAAGLVVRSPLPGERRLAAWAREVSALARRLADEVAAGRPTLTASPPAPSPPPARLASAVQRLPNCFRSFDQRPEDCARLVERFAHRWPERTRRLVVLGVRTSGSYLAPLCAAHLARAGYELVETLTYRPELGLLRRERRALATAAAAGARVLVVDDAPRRGGTMREVCAELAGLGIPARAVVALLPMFDDSRLPPELAAEQVVALPWTEWAIHDRLRDDAVRATLAELLGQAPRSLRRVELTSPARGHAHVRYEVELAPGETRHVLARGTGLGYLGRHPLAVADRLEGFVPAVHGLRDGVLYREWLPDDDRLDAERAGEGPAAARRVGAYVVARRAALPVADDRAQRVSGSAWEVVAGVLGASFARLRLAVRPLVRRAARRLLAAPAPAVVDGDMAIANWFGPPAELRKARFAERAFAAAGTTAYSFDPAFDLAGALADREAAVGVSDPGFAAELLAAYGEAIEPERWLLLQLVHHLLAQRRGGSLERLLGVERAVARAAQAYVGARFLADVEPRADGPLCAIDVDGVAETRWLGAPAMGPDGALALRALAGHGFRAVLVTGRGLPEVRERCMAYGLAGGVAAYGAAVYDHRSGEEHALLAADDRARLQAARDALARRAGVVVDPLYVHSVRAYRPRPDGERGPVNDDDAAAALAAAGGADELRVIPGDRQSDFVARVDKGDGLRALAERLDAPVALAVGDSAADLPMLALAERACTPARPDPELRGHARVMHRRYQAGLRAAVASLVGHSPRRCPVCRPPALPREAAVLVAALRAKDAGRWGRLAQAARLLAG
jgi:adenine/guanine phosphoribosyltransferase-like PRPP-binding protein